MVSHDRGGDKEIKKGKVPFSVSSAKRTTITKSKSQ
jgi:hypothetical protein